MVPLYSRVRSLNMFRHSVTGGVGCGALSRQVMRGQSMVEFLIVLPSLLLIVLGILQFSLMYQARNLLNHAAFIGARQGALSGGNMTSIKDGVASAMAPLFMRVSLTSRPAMSDVVKARLISTIEIFNLNTALIEILNPTPDVFKKHNLNGAIPNDNLMYRSTASAEAPMAKPLPRRPPPICVRQALRPQSPVVARGPGTVTAPMAAAPRCVRQTSAR